MPSKMVTDREKVDEALVAALANSTRHFPCALRHPKSLAVDFPTA